jgi:predicted PurR-regulated permease PerM
LQHSGRLHLTASDNIETQIGADKKQTSMAIHSGENDAPIAYSGARRIVWLVLLIAIGWTVLTSLRSVVLLFAIVFLLAMMLNPVVNWLERRRIPRIVCVALVVLALVAIAVTVLLFAVPPLAAQVQELIHNWPSIWKNIRARLDALVASYPAVRDALPQTDEIAGQIGTAAGTVGNFLVRSTLGLVGGAVSLLLMLLLLVFVLVNPQPLVAGYLAVAPDRYREQAKRTLVRMMRQMQAWARGVAINGCIIGLSIGIGLRIIGVPLALMFGAFGFLGEFLPNIGAFLVSIPILFLALSLGATKFWLALGLILLVYQVEINLLVPLVLGREMRLHPVTILFFTLAMASLFGIFGAILALPTAALVHILIDEFYLRPRKIDRVEINREATAILRGKA